VTLNSLLRNLQQSKLHYLILFWAVFHSNFKIAHLWDKLTAAYLKGINSFKEKLQNFIAMMKTNVYLIPKTYTYHILWSELTNKCYILQWCFNITKTTNHKTKIKGLFGLRKYFLFSFSTITNYKIINLLSQINRTNSNEINKSIRPKNESNDRT
jgi:hypothetical protein